MAKVFRICWCFLAAACGCLLGAVGYYYTVLPEEYTVTQGCEVHINAVVESCPTPRKGQAVSAAAVPAGEQYRAQLRLFGTVPVKDVTVAVTTQPVVTVCGSPFGIKIYTNGVLVVGMSDISTAAGKTNPAAAAGVCVGDTILSVNGDKVTSSREVARLVNGCQGKAITLGLLRDGVEFTASFVPARPVGDTGYRLGLWIRDSAAGVGTLTFYDPETRTFAGLGHAVCDVDTGEQMSLSDGEIVPARIFGVKKSESGKPGELKGCFEPGTLGELKINGEEGLYGHLTVLPTGGCTMPVAAAQQVHTGPAEVLVTLDGTKPQAYSIVIRQVKHNGLHTSRHMIIEITDSRLLALSGGIVQGMSGSPIIQDGHLAGAVTHVLVDTPTRGYGIFAETMLQKAKAAA